MTVVIDALQVEELKSSPSGEGAGLSAPEIVANALDEELNAPASSSKAPSGGPVNDLTSMVVKKKKRPLGSVEDDGKAEGETNGSGKRKAEDEDEAASEAKKAKV